MAEYFDSTFLNMMADLRSPVVDFIFLTITYTGGYMTVFIVTALSVLTFYKHRHEEKGLVLLLIVFATALSTLLLKEFFAVERPSIHPVYLESTYSFPSGHAALAMVLYGFLFLNIKREDKHYVKRSALTLLALLILAIGVSRSYLGLHFISDILGGYILGAIWLYVGERMLRRYYSLLSLVR